MPDGDSRSFERLVEALAGREGITVGTGRGFGSGTLQVDGRIFAIGRPDGLVLKLPARRVAELIADGDGMPFDAGKGRPLKEWVALDERSLDRWFDLAIEAASFVRGRPVG